MLSSADPAQSSAPHHPKLLLFLFKYGPDVPAFIVRHRQEHIRCLEHSFAVTTIIDDCDFQEVCEAVQPDIVVFESGVNHTNSKRLKIQNIRGFERVPRVGFLNADGWCETRAGILADMEEWGIGTAFTISVTSAEHTLGLADQLFVWPTFVEGDTFTDYELPKIVPILITGSQDPQYPWRHRVYSSLIRQYPSLVCPHGGYGSRSATRQMLFGERYARAINASSFAPTCGTVAREVVRKHFEIPGCRTCLITEETEGLKAAGFIDMVNCVFADESNAADKVAYLLEHPETLATISAAGYELVHSHHTSRHRDQLRQWFVLHNRLRSDEVIVQPNPFEPLQIVKRSAGEGRTHITSNGLHLQLLKQGERALEAGEIQSAERLFRQSGNYMPLLPETQLKLALCSLNEGNAKAAEIRLVKSIRYTLVGYGAATPDPIEWAYWIVSLLCLGKVRSAARRASQFPALRHPELDRARWVAGVASGTLSGEERDELTRSPHATVHHMPNRSFDSWLDGVCGMLRSCGQAALAEQVSQSRSSRPEPPTRPEGSAMVRPERTPTPRPKLGPIEQFQERFVYERLRDKASATATAVARRLTQPGRRQPGRDTPTDGNVEWLRAVRLTARDEPIRNALILGWGAGDDSTDAFVLGASENRTRPTVFCFSWPVGETQTEAFGLADQGAEFTASTKSLATVIGCAHHTIDGMLDQIRLRYGIERFDAVMVRVIEQTSQSLSASAASVINNAAVVILDTIDNALNFETYERLEADESYEARAYTFERPDGAIIFAKRMP